MSEIFTGNLFKKLSKHKKVTSFTTARKKAFICGRCFDCFTGT